MDNTAAEAKTDDIINDEVSVYSQAAHVDATKRTSFSHQPLDHSQPFLRLIRINEHLSEDGLVRCRIYHAPRKKRSYMCLSYVWDYSPLGMKEHDRTFVGGNGVILLNGQYFEVRGNLHAFLRMAQREGTTNSPTRESRPRFDLSSPL